MSIYLGVDIGTSGVRTVAFSLQGKILAEGRAGIELHYTESGQAEQDPQEWLNASIRSMQQVAVKLGTDCKRIKAIGLTGQCPTFTLLYDNGETLNRGFIYQDNRAIVETENLIRVFGKAEIHRRTGQNPSPFYILPKLIWLKKNKPEYFNANATVMQPRDYVGWHLTGVIGTDPSHAACTLAYDLAENRWINEWMNELGLANLSFPDLYSSSSILGNLDERVSREIGISSKVPVAVGGADSLCAVFGSATTGNEQLCDITGSSTCLHLTVSKPVSHLSVNTYPHVVEGTWCAEAGINTSGIAFTWLTKLLGVSYETLIESAKQVKPGSDGLLFLPHLSGGERDKPHIPGAFIGITLEHSAGHFARAVLEGIAFALRMRIDFIKADGHNITCIHTSGGGAKNPLWNQIKADIFNLPVECASIDDTTALGAAMTAAAAIGENIILEKTVDCKRFYPDESRNKGYEKIFARFCRLENLFSEEKDLIGTSEYE